MGGALEGQVALVTGGASGIGRATADLLATHGAKIAVLDRQAPPAGADALFIHADLTELGNVETTLERVVDELGRLDILVNCAGVVASQRGLLDVEIDDWERVFRVNVTAPMLLMKAFARHAIARGGGGRIVNVASSSAFRARNTPPAYGSSKAALVHLTRTVAAELGPHGINVNAVAPGVTDTAIVGALRSRDGLQAAVTSGPLENFLHRVAEPSDVAEAIVFLCLPSSRQITGQTVHTSAGAIV